MCPTLLEEKTKPKEEVEREERKDVRPRVNLPRT
jgi:hypothetical protein